MKISSEGDPIRMIDFISQLYTNYKLLNKISEKESIDFQQQVVTMLVDSKQNVDAKTLNSFIQQVGIEGFVLNTLAKVINRNPFKNHFELNRNLATITENLKKDQDELIKKQKILQRKEEKIKTLEQNLMNTIKQKMLILENQSTQRLVKKQNQVKKAINSLINQLKSKQKLLLQRFQQCKNNQKTLSQIIQKEKSINEKLKFLEKKEKQLKSKDNEISANKKQSQILQYKDSIQRLSESLRQSSKRYKNLELAYRKVKNCKIQQQKRTPPLQLNAREGVLDQLQLSQINEGSKDHCEQLINFINLQQLSGRLQQIKLICGKNQSEKSKIDKIKQIFNLPYSQTIELEDDEEEELEQELMPPCLYVQPIKQNKQPCNIQNLLQRIKEIPLSEDENKLKFIHENKLEQIVSFAYSLNCPYQVCEMLLQRILELIQESPHYLKVIQYLSSGNMVDFFQHIYLSHETNTDIIETTTLILSRIKLKDYELVLNSSFTRALQLRMKVENKNSFLYGNIHFILN